MPYPKVKLSDNDGNTVAVDTSGASNALNVKLSDSDNIDIGNVVLTNSGGSNIHVVSAVDGETDLDGQLLLGTHALLSARTDDSTTIGITALDGTHNALHVSISDGTETANVNSSNQLEVAVNDGSGTALTSNSGKLDVCLHSEDGTAITESGGFLDVSIRSGSAISSIGQGAPNYVWAMGMEYADFDGNALPFDGDINTEGNSTPFQGSKYGVQYIMLVNEDGSKSPIDQTSGRMRTTHGITGLGSDDNASVSDTTPEKISGVDGDVSCHRVDIMAHPDNTGYIWIGDNAVSVDGLNGGIRLAAGDFYSMDIDNTGDVYAIATVDNENVCFNYFT